MSDPSNDDIAFGPWRASVLADTLLYTSIRSGWTHELDLSIAISLPYRFWHQKMRAKEGEGSVANCEGLRLRQR